MRGALFLVSIWAAFGWAELSAQSRNFTVPPLGSSASTDSPLTLSNGRVLRQRNLVVFRGSHTVRLTIVIETPTLAADRSRLKEETREVANLYDEFARTEGVNGITVAVCRTQACSELRQLSRERFDFVRGRNGRWEPQLRQPIR